MNLKNLRKSLGLNQNEVADKLNIKPTTYWGYENGSREMDYSTLIKLADFFGCSIDYLLNHKTSGIIHVDSLSVPEQKLLSYMKQLDADQILRLVGYCEVILGITNSNLKPVRPW